ncbi:MAG TPA: HAMP domain-containing sensor histidine kinase [Clostridium sp.]
MKTIKTKMFLIFSIFMVSLVALGIFLNSIFLESYYIYKNKGILKSISEKINNEYITDKENSYEYIITIANIENISTTIVDQNFNIEYNSLSQKKDTNEKRFPKEMKQIILDNEKKLSKNFVYYTEEKNNAQTNKLVFILKMSNGEYIILKKPFKSINQSVSIANQFYMLAGVIVIFIGGIFILIFSKKITRPIIEMSYVAENISNLEFDKRVHIGSQDEIGKLGESINKISEKLSTSINDLKQDVERRKNLVSNMSHELKTPIGIIKGYAEGLKYGVVDDKEKMQKYCSILVEECDRMDKLVQELLNHSKMEGGMVKLNRTKFDIYEFISKIVERFNPTFIDKGITFDFKCMNKYIISADRDMLEKAINNFMINAIDYVEGRKFIQLIAENKESNIKISIFNTGNHIPTEDLSKIWDLYYKVDKARSRKYGGHGLGLAIVKSIVQLHGGITKVENVDEGVVFSLEIP